MITFPDCVSVRHWHVVIWKGVSRRHVNAEQPSAQPLRCVYQRWADTSVSRFKIVAFWEALSQNNYGNMWRMGRCCMQQLATCVCVCFCSDKTFRRLVFFPNPCEMIVYTSLLVCFCCLSGTNDSLEGCLGKQTWEGDEEEEVEGMKEACSSCRLHIDWWAPDVTSCMLTGLAMLAATVACLCSAGKCLSCSPWF